MRGILILFTELYRLIIGIILIFICAFVGNYIQHNKYEVKDEEIFFKIVKDSFKQKRKTIKNNLREYNLDIIENVLKQNNFSLSSRAEEIPIEVFIKIANELSDKNDK